MSISISCNSSCSSCSSRPEGRGGGGKNRHYFLEYTHNKTHTHTQNIEFEQVPHILSIEYDVPQEFWWCDPEEYRRWRHQLWYLTDAQKADSCLHMGIYVRPNAWRNEELMWTFDRNTRCPNWANVRPKEVYESFFRVVVPPLIIAQCPIPNYLPQFSPLARSNRRCQIGNPAIDGFDRMVYWGVIPFWHAAKRWGRVVIRGIALLRCHNGVYHFEPQHFPGFNDQEFSSGAAQGNPHTLGFSQWRLGFDPHKTPGQLQEVRRNKRPGAKSSTWTRAQARAEKELGDYARPQLRAEDIAEKGWLKWDTQSLRRHLVCGDVVQGDERLEMRNVRLLRVPDETEAGEVPLERLAPHVQLAWPNMSREDQGNLLQKVPDDEFDEWSANWKQYTTIR